MDQAIFSIVAKNYIPMANALGNSLKQIHGDIPFFIIVADEEDENISFNSQSFPIIPATMLGISRLNEMAFKYNVTEFCTALKPFAFDYLFKQGFQRVIYFDPDIYVFSSLDSIFEQLKHSSLIVTPHICTLQNQYTGLVPEGMIMHVGIFNFGFCAIANSHNGLQIIAWWKVRLANQSYADKIEGLHTDQKWMDFMPSLIDDIYIERGLGYNMAIWNWHERQIQYRKDQFWVTNRITGVGSMPLVFFHFSNFSFSEAKDILRFRPKYIRKFSDLYSVSDYYAKQLENESITEYSRIYRYSYNQFANGDAISHFHRRLFRRITESGYKFPNPFNTDGEDTFYYLLKSNGLIDKEKREGANKLNEESFNGFEKKLHYIQRISRLLKSIIGINRYTLLCKFTQRFVRPENQTFLIKEIGNRIPFYNENRYINWEEVEEGSNALPIVKNR